MRLSRLAAVVFAFIAAPIFAQYRISSWIPTWDPNALTSTQLHAGAMSESNPVWYGITSSGGIAKNSSVSEDPTWLAAMTGTQILPTIQNRVNGSFNLTVAKSVINSTNRDAHAENIRQLVVNKAYEGADIDYESLPETSRSDFSAFVSTLAAKLHASGKKLSVTVYAKTSDTATWDGPGGEDYAAIGAAADFVKLMVYDKAYDTSPPGPIAPLSWIDQVVTYAESQIPSQKIIVGLPWYGYDWVGSSGVGVTYQEAMNTAAANGKVVGYDPNGEATYTYSNHTVYFQDANSYNKKADTITQKHPLVGGFAHWRNGAEDPTIWTRVAQLKGSSSGAAPPPPVAPASLAATATSSTAINLTWTDASADEDGFRIERCMGAGCTSFAQIAQVAANVTAYPDGSLTGSTTYNYRVRAYNAGGTSDYSNGASATTQTPPPVSGPQTLVARGSVWKYLDNGSDQGAVWTGISFDDSSWRSGASELGYGDGDEATTVSYGANGSNKYITTYYRQSFDITDPSVFHTMTLHLLRDDGAVVYLNGQELLRSNMPTGLVGYRTLAATTTADEATWFEYAVDPRMLVAGRNTIAVEVHQADVASSDISFNLDLIASDALPPVAPASLTATGLSRSSIQLAWSDMSSDETSFRIERCSGSACTNFATRATVAANSTAFTDTGLSRSTYYRYRISAVNGGGSSPYSNVATAKTTK